MLHPWSHCPCTPCVIARYTVCHRSGPVHRVACLSSARMSSYGVAHCVSCRLQPSTAPAHCVPSHGPSAMRCSCTFAARDPGPRV
eukprot:638029-Rhodomonas_salina.4